MTIFSAGALEWAAIVFGFAAAALWARASLIKIPNILDSALSGDKALSTPLQKAAKWNAGAAGSAALSVFCQALHTLIASP